MKKLSEADKLFALEYLANGRNAAEAYNAVHPKAKRTTAAANGHKLLRKTQVAAFIQKQDAERQASLIMEADEALQGLTRHGRGDPRKLFKNGRLLPIDQWPDEEADCVKALKPGPFGTAITFYDKQKARTLMAINGGKLKTHHEHEHKFPHLELLGEEPPADDE